MQHLRRITQGHTSIARMLIAAARLGARWLWAVAALGLAIGSAGQPPPAQAQGLWVSWVDVVNPKLVLCPGQTVTYRVRVMTSGSDQPGVQPEAEVALLNPGITLTAEVADASLGDFANATAVPRPIPGSDLNAPDTVEFTFTAKDKTGTTTLTFGASSISFEATPFPVTVTVQHCRYWALAVSRWAATYANGSIKFLAVTHNAKMAVDADGGYSGQGKVIWVSTSAVPGCGVKNSLAISDVTLRGSRDASGQNLLVKFTYGRTTFRDLLSCVPGTGAGSAVVEASALDLTVPLSGGYQRLDQVLSGGPAPINGSADVYVYPVEASQ